MVDRPSSAQQRRRSENNRFAPFGAFRADLLWSDPKDLIVPLCSLVTSSHLESMDRRVKTISRRIDAAPGHGGAVLLDVDARISAIASQIVQPSDISLRTSFRIDGSSYDILNFPVRRARARTAHRPVATFPATRALHPKRLPTSTRSGSAWA